MRKRVGLARTLVTKPSIILYDEPTTGLDHHLRVIHELMFDMQKKLNLTSVIISHDVEIFKFADYVALLHEGQINILAMLNIWESDNPYITNSSAGCPKALFKRKFHTRLISL